MTTLRNPARLIPLFAIAYATVAYMLMRNTAHPDVLAWGVTFDLALTVPIAWWLLAIRGGFARPVTIIPVFVVCTLVASRVVPASQHQFIDQLRWVAAPLDLVTPYLIARGKWSLGDTIAGRIARLEVDTVRYALFSWRRKSPEGFTFHERSGWDSIVVCFLVVIAAESIGMHLFVAHFSVKIAWVVTVLDVYGMLWLIGDYHALRLLPTVVHHDRVDFRLGQRWSVTVDRDNIAAIEPVRSESDWKRKGVLKLAMIDEPRLLIRLREPVVATGLAGITKTIDTIAALPDDEVGFKSALA